MIICVSFDVFFFDMMVMCLNGVAVVLCRCVNDVLVMCVVMYKYVVDHIFLTSSLYHRLGPTISIGRLDAR